jgi:hypothetical protein
VDEGGQARPDFAEDIRRNHGRVVGVAFDRMAARAEVKDALTTRVQRANEKRRCRSGIAFFMLLKL